MTNIIFGTSGKTDIGFDLDTLIPTRLLIQASSGGGKSYLIRKLIEALFGKIQIIVIDPDGEFSSLREKFDFVLVGKDGETPADVRSAGMLAEKLLELNASAICDIYEMPVKQRHQWVRLFLTAMVEAPKKLWHPCIIIVDEAHMFAPEKGQGESEAIESMIDLASRGRKRGFVSIFATQRLGKLSKNACAELQNVLIGSTFIDIDRKRAAETLGILKSEEKEFFKDIKVLEPGEFYALGRAISKEMIKLKVGKVATRHPESGQKHKLSAPPPSAKIKSLLPKLADLPAQAEEKEKTVAELKKQIVELKRAEALRSAVDRKVEQPKIKEIPVLKSTDISRLAKLVDSANRITEKAFADMNLAFATMSEFGKTISKSIDTANEINRMKVVPQIIDKRTSVGPSEPNSRPLQQLPKSIATTENNLGKAERSILTVLAQHGYRNKNQIAILSGYSHSGGGFNNAIGKCRTNGWIDSLGSDVYKISSRGAQVLGPFSPLPTGEALFEHWMRHSKIGRAEMAIMKVLRIHGTLTKEQIAPLAGYEPSGGGFNNAVSRLKSLEIITRYDGGFRLSEELL